tara:strand:- start:7137 stop:7349 length:213 start_codon:yes stop_codon:yes gene_type:complete
MIYIKIFFILLILLLSYLIIEGKFNINCKKCKRNKNKEEFIQSNKLKKSVSFADENNKPLETLIKFSKTI